jgi:Peptidase inhibitor family I36
MKRSLSMAAGMLLCAWWFAGCAMDDSQSDDPGDQSDAADVSNIVSGEIAIVPDAVGPCPSGKVCLYQNGQQTGASVSVSQGISITNLKALLCKGCTNGTNGNDGTFNDQMSSWQNASNIDYCWHPNASFGGAPHLMNAHTQNTVPAEYNDHASSLQSGGC